MNEDDITEAELEGEEGQKMIRLITDRYLQNTNQKPLAKFHPEDAASHLETTQEIFRAFIQIGNEVEAQ